MLTPKPPQLSCNADFHTHWFDWERARCRSVTPSSIEQDWLLELGSLTEKLSRTCAGNYKVQVLQQTIALPNLDEAMLLGIRSSERALIREVLLSGDDQPSFFGRTVIPLSSLRGRLTHLRHWGSRSIGTYLFSHPSLQRSGIQICHQPLQEVGFSSVPPTDSKLWGRRSRFALYNKPFLISEFFLPEFFARLP